MQNQLVTQPAFAGVQTPVRLHYLDWLRVIAILGVFLFHASNVFNDADFHIKNAERSTAITIFQGFLFPWGMPLFFLIAGTGSWFALRRRSSSQYTRERFRRLLIPFLFGCVLLTPIQLYFEWTHKLQTGVVQGSFQEFLGTLPWGLSPRLFGAAGYHLWFLAFLFCFSLITLPLFRWFEGDVGKGLVAAAARLCEHRGAILLFIVPLALLRLSLHPFFPEEHNWSDFFFLMVLFILGYLLFADDRLTRVVRRDWPISLAVGVAALLGALALALSAESFDIEAAPRTAQDFAFWGLVTVNSWCSTIFVLALGMYFLDFSHKWLRYGQEAILPFFVVHQPVIIVIAFFVVQWNAALPIKVAAVLLGSFVVSIGLYELIIKRIGPLRVVFGMKSGQRETTQAGTTLAAH
jgi:glucans biosynthesis protein C